MDVTGIESVNLTIDVLNRSIGEATGAPAEATNRVMQGMEQTNTLSRETHQRMDDMAELAKETGASTEEIASASSELSCMAEQLRTATERFKVR